VLCPQGAADHDRLALEAEESVSVDVTTLTLTTVD
jgi:hypothetical protein